MIKIYRDLDANAIFIEDANGAQFLNSLQATQDDPSSDLISVRDIVKDIEIVSETNFADFVDKNDNTYGNTALDTCNALNAIFQASGTSTTEVPVITSATSISITQGDAINYELTADYGVGYEWENLPSGVTTVEGNVRKLVGGTGLTAGTYTPTMRAINYNGTDSETLTITVSTPPFSNTRSINFNNTYYLGANASLLSSTLGRSGNGSGSSDAWTVAMYFKPSTNSSGQTVFYFGDSDVTNAGHINMRFIGSTDRFRLQYGSNNNYVRFQSAANSLVAGSWHHLFIAYNGGTTGASSGDLADYYSRFTIRIDNTNVVPSGTWSHNNFGYSGAIDADNLRVGRYASGNYMRDGCRVDELAIWDSDQSSNASSIYNSGTPFDLSTLTDQPRHWWRMGDGDSYPNLQDSGTQANCTFIMYNMTSSDIVNDVP